MIGDRSFSVTATELQVFCCTRKCLISGNKRVVQNWLWNVRYWVCDGMAFCRLSITFLLILFLRIVVKVHMANVSYQQLYPGPSLSVLQLLGSSLSGHAFLFILVHDCQILQHYFVCCLLSVPAFSSPLLLVWQWITYRLAVVTFKIRHTATSVYLSRERTDLGTDSELVPVWLDRICPELLTDWSPIWL